MSDHNVISMSGRLTRDVEFKYLPNQTPVAECGLACGRKYKDKEETCFVELTVFGKQAEVFNKYLSKGRQVIITGRLKLDQWEAQDGSKRSKHHIIVNDFTFISDGTGGQRETNPAPQRAAPPMDDSDVPF